MQGTGLSPAEAFAHFEDPVTAPGQQGAGNLGNRRGIAGLAGDAGDVHHAHVHADPAADRRPTSADEHVRDAARVLSEYADAIAKLKALKAEELRKVYSDREMEPAMTDESWRPKESTGL